jgi:hypothetical protein
MNDSLQNIDDLETIEFELTTNFILLLNILWSLIIIFGVSANSFVLGVLICGSRLTSTTQYFIINLATSDITFLLICPTVSLFHYNNINLNYLNGKLFCKFSYLLTHITAFTTCLTLMSMTLDRYLAFNYPLQSLVYRSKKKAILINIFIWSLSFLLSSPHVYYRIYVPENNTGYCTQSNELYNTYIGIINLDQFITLYTVIVAYLLPLAAILWSYSFMVTRLNNENRMFYDALLRIKQIRQQNRKHVLIMIGLVTLLFALCWLPIHCIYLALKFIPHKFPLWNKKLFMFKAFAHTLTFLNSALNPVLYTICGKDFRKRLTLRKTEQASIRSNNYFNKKTLNDTFQMKNIRNTQSTTVTAKQTIEQSVRL